MVSQHRPCTGYDLITYVSQATMLNEWLQAVCPAQVRLALAQQGRHAALATWHAKEQIAWQEARSAP